MLDIVPLCNYNNVSFEDEAYRLRYACFLLMPYSLRLVGL